MALNSAARKSFVSCHECGVEAAALSSHCALRTQQSLSPAHSRCAFGPPPSFPPTRRLRVASNLQQIQCFYITEKNGTAGNQLTWVVFGGQVVTTAGWQVCAQGWRACFQAAGTSAMWRATAGITGTICAARCHQQCFPGLVACPTSSPVPAPSLLPCSTASPLQIQCDPATYQSLGSTFATLPACITSGASRSPVNSSILYTASTSNPDNGAGSTFASAVAAAAAVAGAAMLL